jgi:hypothetical protein
LVTIQLGNSLYAKKSLVEGWTLISNSVTAGYWKVAGQRFGRWDGYSGLWVKDSWGDTWHNVAGTNVFEWSVSSDLTAIRTGTALSAKNNWNERWSNEGNATAGYWKIRGNRLAKWDANSGLWVKDGAAGSWYNVAGTNTVAWDITPTMVVMQLGNTLYAKKNLTDGWIPISNSVTAGYWKVAGERFGRWDGNSGLWVKDSWGDTWHDVSDTNVSEWSVSSDLTAIRIGTALYAKNNWSDPWTNEGSATAGYWKVEGNRLAKWDANSGLWVKDGAKGSWYNVAGTNTAAWSIS